METKRIKIHNIIPNKNNPRSEIGDTSDLEASIKAHGLIQPIVVCWNVTECKYEVVAGSRRLQALNNIGAEEVDCVINYSDDQGELYKIATAENIARKNMTPADECRAVKKMVEQGSDIRSIAVDFGHSVRWAMGRYKMADLGDDVLSMVDDGVITLAHAEVLTMCSSDDELKKFSASCRYTQPEDLKRRILAEKKNLANAPFDVKKTCHNCRKQTICQQDIFGDITDSYCQDGECFCRNVEKVVIRIRRELSEQGLQEYSGDYEWSFKHGYEYIDEEHATERDIEIIEKLKSAGKSMWFLIDEDTAEVTKRWFRNDIKDDDEDAEEDAEEDKKRTIIHKVREAANDKEREAIEKVIDRELDHCTDDLVAIIFDYINQTEYDNEKFCETTVDADGEEYDEGAVANVSPVVKTLNGQTQREYILGKLVDNLMAPTGCCYRSESEREFFRMKSREEYEAEALKEIENDGALE